MAENSNPSSPVLATVRSPEAPAAIRFLALLLLTALLVPLMRDSILQHHRELPDFEFFYKSGAWLLEHGALDPGYDRVPGGAVEPRGMLDWYWPFVPRVMSIFALLPYFWAGVAWMALMTISVFAVLRLLGRGFVDLPAKDWPVTQLVPFTILLLFWYWEFHLNQIDLFTLLFFLASFVLWQERRFLAAGFWLGLAVLMKVTPGFLVIWFMLKRQYRTVAAAVLTVVLAGPVSDMIVLGPDEALGAYRTWLDKAIRQGSHSSLILNQREMDWRNQGLGAVASRWLHPTNWNTTFDNDPRAPNEDGLRTMNIANLAPPAVARLVTGVSIATLAGLFWIARRPASRLNRWQLRCEWALFVLAMLWLMPVMRRYHMIWVLPAASLIMAGIHYQTWRRGWSYLALVALFGVIAAQYCAWWREIEVRGVFLGSVILLAIPILLLLKQLSRTSASALGPGKEALRAESSLTDAREPPESVTVHA